MPDCSVAAVVLIGDAAGVQPPDQAGAEDLDRLLRVHRDAQRPPEIATRSERDHGEPARSREWRAVMEEPVDDFVQGAIAADRDDHRARLPDGMSSDLGRFERARGENRVVPESRSGKPGLDRRPLAAGLPRTRCGVDDEQDAWPGGYGAPPTARRFMTPFGSMLSLIDCHTRIQPPISSATQRALTRPTPW